MGSLSSTQQWDYSTPEVFDPKHGNKANKTIDIGQNGSTLSANIYGRRMLQMVNEENEGFGLCIANIGSRTAVELSEMNTACFDFDTRESAAVRYVVSVDEKGRLNQRAHIVNTASQEIQVEYQVNLRVSVHRASYGQLTEGGPIPLPECENALEVNDKEYSFIIRNKFLGAHLIGQLDLNGIPAPLIGLTDITQPGLLTGVSTKNQSISIAPNSTVTIGLTLHLSPGLNENHSLSAPLCGKSDDLGNRFAWKKPETVETYIVRRNVDYILGNCAIPVSKSEWRLLLLTRRNLTSLVTPAAYNQYMRLLDRTIKGHLEWVFFKAERPHKFWHRSYIITGKPKDGPVYQLDQQCYPMLELCDYFSEYPSESSFVEKILSSQVVTEILEHITSKRDLATGLFPTDETPGDDEVIYPFHFSSHVLLWYTLCQLADLIRSVPTTLGGLADRIKSLADEIRTQTMQHFLIADPDSGHIKIAYLVDGHGKHTFYHDGNDIPTAFAANWGFFSTNKELEAWYNTMSYALSEENSLGYSSGGSFAGLGSVHSQGPWPLGYFQEMLYADVRGDKRAKANALQRIIGAMQWDGTFGEAVNVMTGETTSKAWFSWPGSMIAAAIIDSPGQKTSKQAMKSANIGIVYRIMYGAIQATFMPSDRLIRLSTPPAPQNTVCLGSKTHVPHDDSKHDK
ncbi:Six-hairpin glycosidase-like protein [Trichoderma asperelloides]|nr:Six-hairpin glycosidase-like protein [Trichoderma asperelloides]